MIVVHTQEWFVGEVEKLMNKNVDVIDAIIHVCHENNIELEVVNKLITPSLRRVVTLEASKLNLLETNDSTRCPETVPKPEGAL